MNQSFTIDNTSGYTFEQLELGNKAVRLIMNEKIRGTQNEMEAEQLFIDAIKSIQAKVLNGIDAGCDNVDSIIQYVV